MTSIGFPLQAHGIPGAQGPGDGREKPDDVVEPKSCDRWGLGRKEHEENHVESERERREESVSVGVPRERELQHALLGGGGGLGRLDRLGRLQPLQRWSEPRLGGRRLARTRLAGHGVPNCTYGWEG